MVAQRILLALSTIILLAPNCVRAQHSVSGKVIDSDKGKGVEFASVRVVEEPNVWCLTDSLGRFTLKVQSAVNRHVEILLLGYRPYKALLVANGSYYITSRVFSMDEVVVTAAESRGITSSSRVERRAMEHLQPSSFADILELLPGGKSAAPVLSAPNTIHLREVPISGDNYSTTSLGTSFLIDGAPVGINANMQSLSGAWEDNLKRQDFTGKGVDMRTIATDDIQSVEIIRGIPSVEFGDLTSGLVKVERKKGGDDWAARFKADMQSKLYYLAKGREWDGSKLKWNMSADYLDSKADPRDLLNSYSRVTLSSRLNKMWERDGGRYTFSSNLDYGGSFDDKKTDPDINYGAVDRYKSSYNRYAASATLDYLATKKQLLKSFSLLASLSLQHDRMSRTRLVQMSRDIPAAVTMQTGESDAVVLPYTYTASQTVDGMPLYAYVKVGWCFRKTKLPFDNQLRVGASWMLDKNYGSGLFYDIRRPLYPGIASRPHSYSSIPSTQTLAFYAEEELHWAWGKSIFDMQVGVRAESMLNLPNSYAMHGRVYADPRLNVRWSLPSFEVRGEKALLAFSGGVGQHTKSPIVSYLYPDKIYIDIVQLNYFHTNRDYRRFSLMTYVVDPVNTALTPARNLKWELRGDFTIGGNRLSLTYFEEDMKSGFRNSSEYRPFSYKRYDASGVDGVGLTAPPSLEGMPYTAKKELIGYSSTTNGSRTYKKGVELTFSSQRIRALLTRLTVTGAWFKTCYRNSQVFPERPNVMLGSEQFAYVGYYLNDDGYLREMANTNFTADTDLPRLGLGFSVSAQCVWFRASQLIPESGEPLRYMDRDGNMHDFTEKDRQDSYLSWLVKTHSESLYRRETIPFCMDVNFKATKKLLQQKLTVALFVNNMFDYNPSYARGGFVIRRSVVPYFGVEMNFKI